jgi:hypothetical protein
MFKYIRDNDMAKIAFALAETQMDMNGLWII